MIESAKKKAVPSEGLRRQLRSRFKQMGIIYTIISDAEKNRFLNGDVMMVRKTAGCYHVQMLPALNHK